MNYDRILELSYDNIRILESKKKDDKFVICVTMMGKLDECFDAKKLNQLKTNPFSECTTNIFKLFNKIYRETNSYITITRTARKLLIEIVHYYTLTYSCNFVISFI